MHQTQPSLIHANGVTLFGVDFSFLFFDWHTVQDEEHVILDCPSQDLAELRTQYQHLFSSVQDGSTTRLNDFINQTDALGVATYVAECLKCCD